MQITVLLMVKTDIMNRKPLCWSPVRQAEYLASVQLQFLLAYIRERALILAGEKPSIAKQEDRVHGFELWTGRGGTIFWKEAHLILSTHYVS